MKITLEFSNDILTVRIRGDLDHHLASRVREQVDRAVHSGTIRRILFDFRQVGFMDSSGIGVLMGRYKLMQAVGGEVSAFGVSPMMDRLMTMSGIKKIIGVYETEEQALTRRVAG